jgi:hypothetical protein
MYDSAANVLETTERMLAIGVRVLSECDKVIKSPEFLTSSAYSEVAQSSGYQTAYDAVKPLKDDQDTKMKAYQAAQSADTWKAYSDAKDATFGAQKTLEIARTKAFHGLLKIIQIGDPPRSLEKFAQEEGMRFVKNCPFFNQFAWVLEPFSVLFNMPAAQLLTNWKNQLTQEGQKIIKPVVKLKDEVTGVITKVQEEYKSAVKQLRADVVFADVKAGMTKQLQDAQKSVADVTKKITDAKVVLRLVKSKRS